MFDIMYKLCEGGGIGRRARLRGVWATVRVQVPSFAPRSRNLSKENYDFLFIKVAMRIIVKRDGSRSYGKY